MDALHELNQQLIGQLSPITHVSANQFFQGYSHRFKQAVFVKVFPYDHQTKFQTELAVERQMGRQIILYRTTANAHYLVMNDEHPVALQRITPVVAMSLGTCLAEFHTKIQPFPGIKWQRQPFERLQTIISQLTDHAMQQQLTEQLYRFIPVREAIEHDLAVAPVVCLHGDVGRRNFATVNGRLQLIDFERVQLGPAYQDVIKLFYQDFNQDSALIRAFKTGYNRLSPLVDLPQRTRLLLTLLTAAGIYRYLDRFTDPNFRRCAETMLTNVARFHL